MRRRWWGSLVLLLGGLVARVGAQDRLPEGDTAYADGDLEAARVAYHGALTTPGNDPARLLHLHLRLGILCAALGEDDDAREHFRVVLSLDPDTPPPSELGPRQRVTFEDARDRAGRLDLSLSAPDGASPDAPTPLRVEASPALRALGATLVLRANRWEREVRLDGLPTLVLPTEAWTGDRLQLRVDALDAHGGRLLRRDLELAPTPRPQTETPRRRPWLWVAVGVIAVALVATSVGLVLTRDRPIDVRSVSVS
ncbi:MAG: hypothetical protein R3B99_25445 [Polyangiales bacterium]